MQQKHIKDGKYNVYGVSYLAAEGLDWSKGNITQLTNKLRITIEEGACIDVTGGGYVSYWSFPVVEVINTTCNNDGTFTVDLIGDKGFLKYEEVKQALDGIVTLTLSTNKPVHHIRVWETSDLGCTKIYEIETPNVCGGNQPNFEDFPWLNDIVDLNDCCNNQTVTQYTKGSYSYIYIEANNNCEGVENRLYYKGQLFCEREGNFCYDAYQLQNFEATTLWNCIEAPTGECLANAGTLELTKDNFICDGENWVEPFIAVQATENAAYNYLFFLTNSEGDIIEVSTMQNNYFTEGIYYVYGVSYLASEGLDWNNGNINLLTNTSGIRSKNGACIDLSIRRLLRYFANPVIDLINTNCNNDGTFTVELSTSNTNSVRYGENFENWLYPENGIVALTLSTSISTHYMRAYEFSDAACNILYEIKTPTDCGGLNKIASQTEILNQPAEKIAESAAIKMYPNPVQEILNIQTIGFNTENLQIEIADFTGRIVQTIKPKTGVLQLETSKLKAGNYLLYIKDGSQSVIEKFVKSN